MDRRKWNWLLVLGLILALFMVKSPVEGGNKETLNVTHIGYPQGDVELVYVYGTATYSGAPPTFAVALINYADSHDVHHSSVLATTWITSTSWRLTIDTNGLPDGQYIAEVTATFSTSHTLVDNSFSGGEPDCLTLACQPGP
jgi:hypothetical protein